MADFLYNHDFGCKVEPDYNVLQKQYANWADQARLVSSGKLRQANPTYSVRTKTEVDAVIAFFDSKKGGLTAFTININGEEMTVRFVKGSFWHVKDSPNSWSYGFKIMEVI
jgi:hypothetical protein